MIAFMANDDDTLCLSCDHAKSEHGDAHCSHQDLLAPQEHGNPEMQARKRKIAHDIRWNPELNEWFCALCGRTSDHATATDAIAELEVFECAMVGIIVRPMTREKRTNRANSKKIKLKD